MEKIKEILKVIREKGLYPEIKVISGPSNTPEVTIVGKKVILLCSANYLGLADNNEVKNAVIEGIKKYGIHPTGSQLISGTLDVHKELERKIAEFKYSEDAMIFTSGTMANMGVIPAIVNLPLISVSSYLRKRFFKKDMYILSDELNHATIIDGYRLAEASVLSYKHCDMADLEKKLNLNRDKRKLIITDGVFSMDGDIAPLPAIINLAKKYNSILMVDDAHGTGVLGKEGRGTMEHFGLKEGVDINMGTFSKAFGVLGGFITGQKDLIDYLRVTARTYIFTGGFLGGLACGVLKALEIVKKDTEQRKRLWEMSDHFRSRLEDMGFDTLNTQTPIIPIMIGQEEKAIAFADDLFDKGVFAPCCRWPAVPKGKSRIRFSLMTTLSDNQINFTLEVVEKLGKKYKLI